MKLRTTTIHSLSVTSLLSYKNSQVQALILEAKYHHNHNAQNLLGILLATFIKGLPSVVIVPLPLGKARRRARGYNQVEEVAKCALRHLPPNSKSTLALRLLRRVRETAPQTSLGKIQRQTNMRDAFAVTQSCDPACTYLLFDDVVTTGATLAAAADALTKAGVQSIIVLALAH